ncbi:MAG: LamG-like jellyroll fold domain-containing protein, partial [Planctomycetota bacterium]
TTRGTSAGDDAAGPATTIGSDGLWHHIVASFGGGRRVIYIDGAPYQDIADTGTISATNDPVAFGGKVNNGTRQNFHRGPMDDVRIYNRVLSATEMIDLAGGGDVQTGLVGHWKVDDGTGTTAVDSAGGNHGTLEGDPTWVTPGAFTGGATAGGGGYGGRGGYPGTGEDHSGRTYGRAELVDLLAGSGGGSGFAVGGGAGGGAIELKVGGTLTIASGVVVSADGGVVNEPATSSVGGGGSGGAVKLQAGSVVLDGAVEAKGGSVSGLGSASGGGGGRIAIYYAGSLSGNIPTPAVNTAGGTGDGTGVEGTVFISAERVTVSPTSGLVTREDGASVGLDTFTVRLNFRPVADVQIGISSSNTDEGTVSPASLTFTPSNWEIEQTVTVTAVNDTEVDGTVSYTVITGDASSSDPMFENVVVSDVEVRNMDDEAESIGLVSWWKLDDGAGYVASDSAGTNHGSLMNMDPATDWIFGQVGAGALQFDGINDYVDAPSLSLTTNAITIAAWVRHDAFTAAGERYVTVGADVAYLKRKSDGKLQLAVKLGGSYTTLELSGVLIEGAWVHIVGTFDDDTDTQRLYINGSQADEKTGVTGTMDAASGARMSSLLEPFCGVLDDVRVYDRAISPAEVQALYDLAAPKAIVLPASGLFTREDGATDTFTVRLNIVPTADVTVALSSSDTGEGTIVGAASNELVLTFTTANWSAAQTVTVAGADDLLLDGGVPYSIVTTKLSSTDTRFHDLDVADISVVNLDDDTDADLVAWWRFDEGAGTTAVNSVRPGTYDGAVAGAEWVGGKIDGALGFSETNDTVILTSPVPLGDEWTITVWYNGLRPDNPATWSTLTQGQTADDQIQLNLWVLGTNVGGFQSAAYNAQTVETGWHHLAAVGGSSQTRFYVDGSYVGTAAAMSMSDIYAIGNQAAGGERFASIIDDVRVYSRAFTGTEVQGLYGGALPGVALVPSLPGNFVTGEDGTSDGFSVALNTQPASEVTISVTSSDVTEGLVNGAPSLVLTFDTGNWNIPQVVSVDGVDDPVQDGHIDYTITMAVSSADPDYQSSVEPLEVGLVGHWELETGEGQPSIVSAAPTTAVVDYMYEYKIEAFGLPGPVTVDVDIPSPSGDWLTFDSSTNSLYGTPSGTGNTNNITVTATNPLDSISQVFQIEILDVSFDGLNAEYWNTNNNDMSGPADIERIDPEVNFPDNTLPWEDSITGRWTGMVKADETGTYRFELQHDDGVRLWIDGVKIIDSGYPGGTSGGRSGSIDLTAGLHTIELHWTEGGGGEYIIMRWQPPSSGEVVVPQTNLTPVSGATPPAAPALGAVDLIAEDSAGTNDGALTNMHGAEWRTGRIGTGLSFDGTNDYVQVPHD